ncbi:EpsG family protein [uncultured Shewanella sp.]|uniref:EpsG family protein n=1 Tax=uncultured Shewanella sp. TaxID=173975 RepID=UPI00260AE817|nr:EpsG family protein [uncultured Shewanella sp.]
MSFYILIGVITALYACVAAQLKNFRIIFFLPLIVLTAYFIGYRDLSIGTDTIRYGEIFADIKPLFSAVEAGHFGFEAKRIEIGFVFVASTLKELGVSFNGFLFILNFCTLLTVYSAFNLLDQRLGPVLFFLYTCTFTFLTLQYNIVRQGVAVAICMYAFIHMIRGRHWSFLLFALLAASFHSMSILFLCIWPFRGFQWKSGYIFFFIACFLILANVDFLSEFANFLAPYSTSMYRVANYMITQSGSTNLMSLAILFDLILISYCMLDNRYLRGTSKHFDVTLTAFVIGFLGMTALHELNLLSLRLFYLFCPYEVYLFMTSFNRVNCSNILKSIIVIIFGFTWLLKNLFLTAQFITFY